MPQGVPHGLDDVLVVSMLLVLHNNWDKKTEEKGESGVYSTFGDDGCGTLINMTETTPILL